MGPVCDGNNCWSTMDYNRCIVDVQGSHPGELEVSMVPVDRPLHRPHLDLPVWEVMAARTAMALAEVMLLTHVGDHMPSLDTNIVR